MKWHIHDHCQLLIIKVMEVRRIKEFFASSVANNIKKRVIKCYLKFSGHVDFHQD